MQQMKSNPTLNLPVIRVAIVDDHPWVRKGLLALLASNDRFVACGEAEDAQSATKLVAESSPDLAIIDISLKGELDGIGLARQLRASHPDLLILSLSLHAESEYEARALAAGATAYLCKSDVGESLLDTLARMTGEPVPGEDPH